MLSFTTPAEVALNLARRIRDHRLSQGWSQAELAERSGLKLSTYILFERTGRIAFLRLLRVLEVLGSLAQIETIAAQKPMKTLDELVAPMRKRGRKQTRT